MSSIKVITFDLDNTLWDVDSVLINAEETVYQWLQTHTPELTERYNPKQLRQHRLEFWRANPEFHHQISALRRAGIEKLLIELGYKPDPASALSKQAFEVFLEARHQVEFFDHALAMLDQLSQHYLLGGLSNGNACPQRLGMESLSFHISAEQVNASKPDAVPFQAALDKAGAQPSEMIHVGDSPKDDIAGAQQLGIHTIWVNHGQEPYPNTTPPASAEVHRLNEIPAAVAAIEKQLQDQSL